jgi:hypothetical protein
MPLGCMAPTQVQIDALQAAIAASAARAAALKARAEQGEVAQGRLCLSPGPAGDCGAAAAAAAAAGGGDKQEAGSSSADGQVSLEDLSTAVAAAYQR